ncbi:MAG: glycosyltransferase [Lachnospiraceae bacterium]|nr:glycosyltransferase [Lachnospiraceae bacterium]
MIVPNQLVKGGIASVVNGYRGSQLEKDYQIIYVESYRDGSKVQKFFKAIGSYFIFLKVLLRKHPDIIHIHSSFGPSFYRKIPFIYLAKWAKIPIINHCHGAEFDSFFENAGKQRKALIHKVYSKCNRMIALSDEWKQSLAKIVPAEHIAVIENYSIISKDAVQERQAKKMHNQVLFLGEIGKRKGCYDIPEVIAKVSKAMPEVKFVIAGAGEEDAIKRLMKEKNINKNVSFPGWIRGKQKEQLLRESDLFFLPSYHEGMPMAILDAMGYGLAIVSTNVGGIPKIVLNNQNGYTINPGDISGFSKAIISILGDEEKLKRFQWNSYQIADERYSLKAHINAIETLYEKVLKEKKRGL